MLPVLSVPARKWAIIPEPGEPLRNVAIPVGDHVRRTQMADRLQRNDGFFEADSDVQWLHSRLSWVEMTLPEETEAGSAGKQPAKGYFGLRCANGVSGSCRLIPAGAAFLRPD